MISILLRLSLLIGITICLAEGTSGAVIENKEVLSAPINNPINKVEEGAIKFNVLKREAIPDTKAGSNGNNKGRFLKEIKKKNSQGSKKRGKKNNGGKRNNPLQSGKGKRKQTGRNGKNKTKTRKGRNKQTTKNENKKNKNKNKLKKKRKSKNNQLGKKGKRKNNAITKKKARGNWKGKNRGRKRQNRQCPSDCTIIISDSIKIYRKYLNHQRKIKRTINWLTTITSKGSAIKRKKLEEDADWLASVTNNGTDCPGNNTAVNIAKVIEHVAGLKECASDTGPIAKWCNISVIPDVITLQKKQNLCVTTPPSFASYQGWIDGVTVCFETTRTCQCFIDMNGPNNNLPNDKPYSCQFPNNPPDWINDFTKATNDARKKCKAELEACKDLERQACELTSMCCANAADGATTAVSGNLTTAASGRRMKIKASMIKQLHKMNIH